MKHLFANNVKHDRIFALTFSFESLGKQKSLMSLQWLNMIKSEIPQA